MLAMTIVRTELTVSPAWIQVAILTFVVGFGILGYLAYRVYAEHPPVPRDDRRGRTATVLFTRDDVFRGQLVFEKYGLMEYGTIFGHGAYLGPDFTADYIERAREAMRRYYAARGAADPDARIVEDFKTNRWDATRDVLDLHARPGRGLARARRLLPTLVRTRRAARRGLRRPSIAADRDARAGRLLLVVGLGRDREPARQVVLVHEQLAARAGASATR